MIARELVTKLGFNIDDAKLKKLDTSLEKTKSNIQNVSKSIDTMKQSISEKSVGFFNLKSNQTIDPKLFLPENADYLLSDYEKEQLNLKKKAEKVKQDAKDNLAKIKESAQKVKATAKESAQKIKDAAKEFNEALSKFSDVVNKAKYAVVGLVGTFTGLSALSLSVAKDTVALDVMAKQLKVTTEDLQTLELVAQQSGVEVNLLTKSFSKFNKDINAVNFSTTLAAKQIKQLGVSVYNTEGKLRDSKDVFIDVAKKINNISDTSKQAALSQKLFGTSNLFLVKTLALNSEEFAKQRAEVLKLGYVIDSKGIKSSQNFIKSWSQFKIIINGIRQELAIKFMPVFTDVVDKFKEWYGENRKLISSGIDNFVNITSKSFNLLLKTIDLLLVPVKAIIDLFGGFENTIQILGITIGITLIPKLLTLITTFKALTVAMLANPIGLATAAFAALGAAIALVYNDIDAWMKGNKSLIGYLIDEWKIFEKTLNSVSNILESMANIFDGILPKFFDLGGLFDPTGILRNKNKPISELEKFQNNPFDGNAKIYNYADLKDRLSSKPQNMNPASTMPFLNDTRTVRNNVTQSIGEVNITVPAGTTQEQAASINQQVVDLMQEQLSQFTLRGMDSLSNR